MHADTMSIRLVCWVLLDRIIAKTTTKEECQIYISARENFYQVERL